MVEALGHRSHEVRRLRALLRDAATRREARLVPLEGPRLVADALDRGAILDAVYLGPNARRAFAPLVERLTAAGVALRDLREGVLERLGSTRTPQPVLGVTAMPTPLGPDALAPGLVVVTAGVQDPGNLGTILRGAEAAGAVAALVVGGADPWSPKVVRASAGAVLGLPVLDASAATLASLRDAGWRVVAATAGAGTDHTEADLTGAVALVVGSEAHGIGPELDRLADEHVRIPMAGPTESLNVAMATTVLVFEAARQRRVHPGNEPGRGGPVS